MSVQVFVPLSYPTFGTSMATFKCAVPVMLRPSIVVAE